jgi:hypothetical protein
MTDITSNVSADTHISTTTRSHHTPPTLAAAAQHIFGTPTQQYLNAITIATNQAIANIGTTSIFIMDGLDMVNKGVAKNALTINLPDGKQIMSMHICNICILGLPTVLTGHIVSSIKVRNRHCRGACAACVGHVEGDDSCRRCVEHTALDSCAGWQNVAVCICCASFATIDVLVAIFVIAV